MPANLSQAAADGGAAHKVATAVNAYQAARAQFVGNMQELLKAKDNGATMEALVSHDLLSLLTCPLVKDPIMGIQINALSALGQLGRQNSQASHEICACGILDEMVQSLSHENSHIRCAANISLQAIVDAGVLEPVRRQMETLDSKVKETAVKTFNVLVEKGDDFADLVTDEPTIDVCVSHLRMPEDEAPQSMKMHVCLLLANVANHNEPLARRVVGCNALPAVASILQARTTESPLRAAGLRMFSQVAKHCTELAEMVVQQNVMPQILQSLADVDDAPTRRCAAAVVQEVSRRTPELAEVVASNGGCTCLVKNLELSNVGPESLAALLSMGHIASMRAHIAKQLLDADAATSLKTALLSQDNSMKGAAGWTVEQIANHGQVTGKMLADAGLLVVLEPTYNILPEGETKTKIKAAAKAVVKECKAHTQLEPLVKTSTPPDMLRHVLAEFASILPGDTNARRSFVTSGALKNLQSLSSVPKLDDRALECINEINGLFPEDVVNYYKKQ